MEFKKYEKIHHINKDESDWILDWLCYIQEKIDWSNLSVWTDNWEIKVWSRNQDVSEWSFRGAVEYINTHEGIKALLDTLEWEIRLYWEWLVPHTITDYSPEAYNHFYLFDIEIDWERMNILEVEELAKEHSIYYAEILAILHQPTIEQLQEYVWMCKIKNWGKGGEWIVVKNLEYVNKFWNLTYAKIVSDKFKEENSIVFWNTFKWDVEMKIVDKYLTYGRVLKIINKIEQSENRNLCKWDINQIIWMVQYDIITEEAWKIQKSWTVDFKRLRWLIGRRTARIAVDHFDWNQQSIAIEQSNDWTTVEEFLKVINTSN